MYIYIEHPSFKIHTFKVEPTDTISKVKEIKSKFKYPVDDQKLVCGGRTLKDHHPLEDSNLQEDSLLQLCTNISIKLSVKFVTGDPLSFTVGLSDTIKTVKDEVLDRFGVESTTAPLVYNGLQLKRSYRLSEYNIQDGAVFFYPL